MHTPYIRQWRRKYSHLLAWISLDSPSKLTSLKVHYPDIATPRPCLSHDIMFNIGMHMLPGENVEKLEGAPNFRQVGTYSTLYFHELERLGFLLTFLFSGYWLPNFRSWSANRGRILQSAGEDESSVASFKLRRPCSCSCSR